MTTAAPGRLRLAELTSGVGALVLGIGIGALVADHLGFLGLPLLLGGGAAHAWGMYDKHRLERQADAMNVWWNPLAYWTCWGLLAVLALVVAAQAIGMI